jgi:hypothetical protein
MVFTGVVVLNGISVTDFFLESAGKIDSPGSQEAQSKKSLSYSSLDRVLLRQAQRRPLDHYFLKSVKRHLYKKCWISNRN